MGVAMVTQLGKLLSQVNQVNLLCRLPELANYDPTASGLSGMMEFLKY